MKNVNKKLKNIIIFLSLILSILIVCILGYLLIKNPLIDNKNKDVEKYVYLDNLDYDYARVGHGNLSTNKDSNGDLLSLYQDGEEVEFEYGFFAHAYSTIVFENLKSNGFTYFETIIGTNKTSRVNNTQISVIFKILDRHPFKGNWRFQGAIQDIVTIRVAGSEVTA